MSLENIQAGTNRQRVAAGNVSASNDPTQWKHDGTEQLIKGAELAAAGRTLGMSEEETLAAVSRQYRRQRRADDRVSPQDVLRQMTQAASTTREDVGAPEIKGVSYSDTSEIDEAFGRTDYEMGLRNIDADNGEDNRSPEPESRGTRRYRDGRVEGMRNPVRPQEEDFFTPDVAPKSALSDALSAVEKEKGKRQGLAQSLGRVFGRGGEVDAEIDVAEAALRRHLEPEGPQDARIGRATVRQDNQNYNPEVQEANYYRAEAKALQERDRLYGPGGYGRRGDINLGNVQRQSETQGEWMKGEMYETDVLPSLGIEQEIARRYDGVYLDPDTGNTVAVQNPAFPPKPYDQDGGSNAGTADAVNAPQTARSWLAQNLGQTLDSMKGSDRIEQVDITQATTTAANKVRDYYKKVGVAPTVRVPENIRSVEELQRVVDRVLQATNGQLTVPDLVKGGGAQTGPAGREVEAALTAMGMRPGEQQQLSQAMYQVDAARRSSVNENPTGVYLSRTGQGVQGPAMDGSQTRSFGGDGQFTSNVQFDSATEMDKGIAKAPVARIPRGSTIGVRVEDPKSGSSSVKRRNIVDQLRTLPSRDASMPYMGQVAGEKPRVNRYTRTGESNSADAAIAVRKQAEERAKGGEVDAARTRGNQVRAMLLTEREKRDNTSRAEAASELIAQLPPNARRTRLGGR